MDLFTGTVAVTGLNATENPGPGVSVIRAIREGEGFKGRIVGLEVGVKPDRLLPDLP